MKKFFANPAQSYVTPEVEVAEVISEGVLCTSAAPEWRDGGFIGDDDFNF